MTDQSSTQKEEEGQVQTQTQTPIVQAEENPKRRPPRSRLLWQGLLLWNMSVLIFLTAMNGWQNGLFFVLLVLPIVALYNFRYRWLDRLFEPGLVLVISSLVTMFAGVKCAQYRTCGIPEPYPGLTVGLWELNLLILVLVFGGGDLIILLWKKFRNEQRTTPEMRSVNKVSLEVVPPEAALSPTSTKAEIGLVVSAGLILVSVTMLLSLILYALLDAQTQQERWQVFGVVGVIGIFSLPIALMSFWGLRSHRAEAAKAQKKGTKAPIVRRQPEEETAPIAEARST